VKGKLKGHEQSGCKNGEEAAKKVRDIMVMGMKPSHGFLTA
jgi:hypothetical protein